MLGARSSAVATHNDDEVTGVRRVTDPERIAANAMHRTVTRSRLVLRMLVDDLRSEHGTAAAEMADLYVGDLLDDLEAEAQLHGAALRGA